MLKLFKVLAVALVLTLGANQAYAAVTDDAKNLRDAYSPFRDLFDVTPSDVTEYDPPLRGCIVEVAGDVSFNMERGDAAIGSSDVIVTVIVAQLLPVINVASEPDFEPDAISAVSTFDKALPVAFAS